MISIKDELQQFTSKIEIKGRLETRDGNYTTYFKEFEDAEYEFLVKNKYAIFEFLKDLECVDSNRTYMEDLMYCGDDGKMYQDENSCFHITFHENYCPNIPEENFKEVTKMTKITLAQLKEQQQISSLDEYINMDLSHEEDYQGFKGVYPKSVEAIEKLPTDKIYVNTADYQRSGFAFERYGSLRAWAYQALEWAYMDDCDEESEPDNWDTVNIYRLFAGFKAETIIDTINDYWQIEVAELED